MNRPCKNPLLADVFSKYLETAILQSKSHLRQVDSMREEFVQLTSVKKMEALFQKKEWIDSVDSTILNLVCFALDYVPNDCDPNSTWTWNEVSIEGKWIYQIQYNQDFGIQVEVLDNENVESEPKKILTFIYKPTGEPILLFVPFLENKISEYHIKHAVELVNDFLPLTEDVVYQLYPELKKV